MDYRSTALDHSECWSPLQVWAASAHPSSSGDGQIVLSQAAPCWAPNPPAPGTQRRLLWPEAALLFGVSVRKLREPYL